MPGAVSLPAGAWTAIGTSTIGANGVGGSCYFPEMQVKPSLLEGKLVSGYQLIEQEGTVLSYTHARFVATAMTSPPVGGATATKGIWLLEANGTVVAKDGAPSLGSYHAESPAVALVATADRGGYWIVDANGTVHPFGDAALAKPTMKLTGTTVAMASL